MGLTNTPISTPLTMESHSPNITYQTQLCGVDIQRPARQQDGSPVTTSGHPPRVWTLATSPIGFFGHGWI